jgi:hypothetical protein
MLSSAMPLVGTAKTVAANNAAAELTVHRFTCFTLRLERSGRCRFVVFNH